MTLRFLPRMSLGIASLGLLHAAGCADEPTFQPTPRPWPEVSSSVSMISTNRFGVYFLNRSGILEHRSGLDENPYPSDVFTYVSLGEIEACGIRANGSLACWGYKDFQDPGPYEHVHVGSAGFRPICALRRDDKSLRCWSFDFTPYPMDAADGRYQKVSIGDQFAEQIWALREDGTLACWDGRQPCSSVPEGRFVDIEARQSAKCAVSVEGSLVCWNSESLGPLPEGDFVAVSIGAYSASGACALRRDHGATCWGWPGGHNTPPPGAYRQVSEGYFFACGVRTDDTLVCWGDVPF